MTIRNLRPGNLRQGILRSGLVQLVRLSSIVVLFSASVSALADSALVEGEGRIDQLDLAKNTLTISGRVYAAPIDVPVSINGSYGAFSMLQRGMQVRFEYNVVDGSRILQRLSELPAGAQLEES